MKKAVILCVDDEKVVLTSLKAQLKNEFDKKYTVETAESGEEAIEIVNELLKEKIELPVVIADQIMPGMKGDEFLTEIYQISPQTHNIMLTGQANAEAVGKAVNQAHLYRYISKPWDATDLNLTIAEAVRSFFKDKTIKTQNEELEKLVNQLKEYSEELEEKVKERTTEVVRQQNVLKKNLEKIELLNQELKNKNISITDSIEYAKLIQDALLPPEAYINELLHDNFILFKPKDIVSGDFYWVRQINEYIIIIAADCSGHGVPGAFMSMLGISFINEIVRKREITQANQVLNELRKEVKKTLRQTGKKGQPLEGMDMAICVINTKNNSMQYAGAYNSLYMIRNNKLDEIVADRMPVGMYLKEEHTFTNHNIEIQTGDIFYIYTDGYADQFGGEKNNKYSIKAFRSLLIDIHQKTMIEQRRILNQTIENWKKGQDQLDDILVMGFRV
ncbi:MAG: SpoIIE family protein phosphatase [Bacteroidota bacterium]